MAHRFKNGGPAADVTGRALTDADDVLAARIEVELCVERDHAEHLRHRNVQFRRDGFEHFLRQNGNERAFRVLLVGFQNVHERSKVNGAGRAVARHVDILLVQSWL